MGITITVGNLMQIKQGLVHMLLQIQSSLARFQSTSPILLVWLLQKVNKTHESHSSLIIRGYFNTTVIILLLKFSAGTDNDVPTYFLYSTVPPPCPTKATYWVVLSRFTTTLSLTLLLLAKKSNLQLISLRMQ